MRGATNNANQIEIMAIRSLFVRETGSLLAVFTIGAGKLVTQPRATGSNLNR
jgi:hypothetical protein